MMKESAMWIVKGTFLGISVFAVGAVVFLFLLAFLRSQGRSSLDRDDNGPSASQ
jgi:hypothetical protein